MSSIQRSWTSSWPRFWPSGLGAARPACPPTRPSCSSESTRPPPDVVRARYEELHARQDAGTLEPEEHEELLRIITEMEDLQAQRAEDLARLAQLRGVTLSGLLDSLGIQAPRHA